MQAHAGQGMNMGMPMAAAAAGAGDFAYGTVAESAVGDRASFIMKTYLHLTGAIFAFVFLIAAFYMSGLAHMVANVVFTTGRLGWLVFLAAFSGVSWVADSWARSDKGKPMQYAGLGLYVLAEALIFSPLIVLAVAVSYEQTGDPGGILIQAFITTLALFGGLTGVVFITRKDFSFLKPFIMFAGLSAMVLIGLSLVIGFSLGYLFMWAMVVFAGATILYKTSGVMLHYRTDQYVAAALALFASFALLLWYVIQILMRSRN